MERLVEIVGLGKSYLMTGREVQVLSELDMEVQRGEFIAIMGPGLIEPFNFCTQQAFARSRSIQHSACRMAISRSFPTASRTQNERSCSKRSSRRRKRLTPI